MNASGEGTTNSAAVSVRPASRAATVSRPEDSPGPGSAGTVGSAPPVAAVGSTDADLVARADLAPGAARAAASAAVRATTTPAGAMTEAPTSIRRAAASAVRWYAGRGCPW